MQQFKDKDWLRVIAGHERPMNSVFQIKSCLTRYKLSDVELWQPREGEWVNVSSNKNDFFTVHKWTNELKEALTKDNIFGWKYEPFIGELPSFLKEQK